MLYRTFAIVTVLGAPLLVIAAQSFVPQHGAPEPQPPSVQPTGAPAPVPAPTPPIVNADTPPVAVADPSTFSQPLAGAGQPMLAPGTGLPDAAAPPATGGATPAVATQDAAGAPNVQ